MMSLMKKRGRPSKGPRRAFTVRVREETADAVEAEAVRRGTTRAELVAALLDEKFGPNSVQEELDLSA